MSWAIEKITGRLTAFYEFSLTSGHKHQSRNFFMAAVNTSGSTGFSR
jgi:hypothetical protein